MGQFDENGRKNLFIGSKLEMSNNNQKKYIKEFDNVQNFKQVNNSISTLKKIKSSGLNGSMQPKNFPVNRSNIVSKYYDNISKNQI